MSTAHLVGLGGNALLLVDGLGLLRRGVQVSGHGLRESRVGRINALRCDLGADGMVELVPEAEEL